MAKAKTTTTQATSNEIEIGGNVGDEIVLKYGDARLVLKLGENFILPDFSDALFRAFETDPHTLVLTAQYAYHRQLQGDALRSQCGAIRDLVFDTVKKPSTAKKKAEDTASDVV